MTDQPPPDRFDYIIRFGCGAVAATISGFIPAWCWSDELGLPMWSLLLAFVLLCGFLAMWLGDLFWEWFVWLWPWEF